MAEAPDPGTPLWWVKVLDAERRKRIPEIRRFNDYYDGKHDLLFATDQFKRAFGNRFRAFADNWCQIIVDAVEERLDVVGFRIGDTGQLGRMAPAVGDQTAWTIWQRNLLDADSSLAHSEAFIASRSAVIVWNDPEAEGRAKIDVESAEQVIVAFAKGDRRRRLAALKRWDEPENRRTCATLYLPDDVFKFQAPFREAPNTEDAATEVAMTETGDWVPRVAVAGEEDFEDHLDNPLGVVPVVPLLNRSRIARPPRSEIESVIPLQDAVNKELLDMLVASEFGAFRQRWATGWDVPVNPENNQPIWDSVKASMERFWFSSESDTTFGEFEATDLTNYVNAISMLVEHIASQTRTPPHYLSPGADRLSGESIKAAETGLVSKAMRKMRVFGEAWEEAMRLALRVEGSALAESPSLETIWRDAEVRSESDHIDAVVKRKALGVPNEQLWEDAGYSPQQIERFKAMGAEPGVEEPPAPPAPQDVPPRDAVA